MKNKRGKSCLGIGLLCLFLLGCTKEKVVIQSEESLYSFRGNLQREESAEEPFRDEPEVYSEDRLEAESLWIHICGEVVKPGVYELPAGSRIWDAIQAAQGVTDEGEADYLNQASPLEDGMKITVPSHTQVKHWETSGETGISGLQESTLVQGKSQEGSTEGAKVNLNTADEALLCTLPGIGPGRARSIIAYREENGSFVRIEDIMKVSGIKEAAFAKIKDYISVS